MDSATRSLGEKGEQRIIEYLQKEGFALLVKNYRTPRGEIDLIARQQNLIVFVEVKTRATKQAYLSEVITRTKQLKIIAAAQQYIAYHPYDDCVFRFDVALVEGTENPRITYIPNAFTSQG
jgi:putative endonuclease